MSNEIATIGATETTLVVRVAKKADKSGNVKQTALTGLDLLVDGTRDERDAGVLNAVDKMLASNNFAFVMRTVARLVPSSNLMSSTKHTAPEYLFSARGMVMGGTNEFSEVNMNTWDMTSADLYCKAVVRWCSDIEKCVGKKAVARLLATKVIEAVKAKREAKALANA